MSGRVTAIDVDLKDTDRIFIGTASGGVWKSENGGTTWKPIFDDQPTLSIGSLALNKRNADEIWVGTGEGNPRNSMNTGAGIYKSIDGGKTWKCMGLEKTKVIHRIKIHRDNPNIVYAAAMGSPWGESEDRGVYKTTDGGTTWSKVLYVNNLTGAADLVVDPNNPNKLIAAMWEHKRTPWDFVSGGEGSGLYLSYDGGENWKRITEKEGLPKGDLGRIGIAISPSMPNIVYALVEAKRNGLYKSEDGGEKWKLVSEKNIGNRPFYYSEIYVDPVNENRIYNLWSYVSLSEDGGKTFRTIMNYGNNIHPDHHAFWIHPNDPNYIINGNDGGLNISRDRGVNWTFLSNIPVGQFYHINIDNDFPFNIYGGMQDNGSWVGPSAVLKNGGIRNYDWHELYFGDGFDVVPFPDDSRYGYAMSQGGNVSFYDRETGHNKFCKPVRPDTVDLRFNWNAAIAQDPFNSCGVYFGSQFVHYSTDCGNYWDIISPDLTTNDTTKQHQDISGGLTIDATNAENHTTILCISPSSLDDQRIWVGTDDGNVQLTLDKGGNWTNLSSRITGMPKGAWIPQIIPSVYNEREAFVVVNDYRRNNYQPYIYHTTNDGLTWKSVITGIDPSTFVLSLVQDHKNEKLLFAGTDHGLYFSLDKGNHWHYWSENIPHVQITDLKIHPRDNSLVVGTFGRSIYILDDISPLRTLSDSPNVVKNKLAILSASDGYSFYRRPAEGVRFIAQGDFVGKNRGFDSRVYTWIDSEDEDKKHKVKIQLVDEKVDTIRTFHRELKKGINMISWNGKIDGIRYPGTEEKKGDDLPSGLSASEGEYEIILTLDSLIEKTKLRIYKDPRVQYDSRNVAAQRNDLKTLESIAKSATESFDKLKEMKENMDRVGKIIKVSLDSIPMEWRDLHNDLNDQIDSLRKLYVMPKDIKGIQRNPNNVLSSIWTARRYLNYPMGRSLNTQRALDIAREKTEMANKAISDFIDGDWKEYEEKVNTSTWDILKKVTSD